ncbi:MAG: hypothetical protein RSB18_08990, partial [Clostridia bacterium]
SPATDHDDRGVVKGWLYGELSKQMPWPKERGVGLRCRGYSLGRLNFVGYKATGLSKMSD